MLAHLKTRKDHDPSFDPRSLVGAAYVRVTHSPVALLIAAGLAIILYVGVPELRLVLLAIPVGGALVGLLLWLKHR
jgi:hypothetical protein